MKNLPEIIPEYKITKSNKEPFEVKWEELMGWFLVPKLNEKLSWAMYDFPSKKKSESYDMKVINKAIVHGIEGVEIVAKETLANGENGTDRTFVAQLTDSHCRILSESHYKNDVKYYYTFLDGDDFLPNWGFGEDNCGNETNLKAKSMIKRENNTITCNNITGLLDVVGRYTVEINGKNYDTICIMDIELYNSGIASEQFIDKNGKTVLWRRFNRDDWAFNRYKQRWTDILPNNERITINGNTYVHWYDCITDYIL